jgi:hypothetical protein
MSSWREKGKLYLFDMKWTKSTSVSVSGESVIHGISHEQQDIFGTYATLNGSE